MTTDSLTSRRSTFPQPSPQQLVTRHNAVMFYGLAVASLLENAMAVRAAELLDSFGGDAGFHAWIERVWRSAKAMHARKTRAYLEAMWPEFDWSTAWDAFIGDYRRTTRLTRSGGGIACAALACGAGAAQAAAFYRGLGAATDDPRLRQLLLGMAADEAEHFACFRRSYEEHRRRDNCGVVASYRMIVSCATRARDVDVQLAFCRLGGEDWFGNVPLQGLGYPEFIERLAGVVRRQLPLGPAQRLLFRPWLSVRNLPQAAVAVPPPLPASEWRTARLAGRVYSR